MASSARADLKPSRSARSKITHDACLRNIGQRYPAMTTLEPLQQTLWPETELASMSSVEGSHARTFRRLDWARACREAAADYGTNTSVSFAKFDHELSSWRTSQSCLIEGSETLSGRWPRSGTILSGIAYQRHTLGRPSSAIVSGCLPSPNARDGKDVSSTSAHLSARLRHQPSAATRLLTQGVPWRVISQVYELIMGFPSRWSETESMVSATPSSRKSRKSSAKPSLTA